MAAAVLIDGRGAVLKNRVVTIRNGKIERIAPRQPGASVTYDLGNRTLLPGFIDTHVHMDSHFGVDGRAENRGETQLQRLYAAVDNAYATVAAGYTTAQSIGSAIDADLRKVIEAGDAYGPRLVTSLGSFSDTSKSPAQVREWVRAQVAKGADLIKIFASKSIREGGAQTLSDAQIAAACDEATTLGKRSWVHAHASSAVRASALGGCWAVTHGSQATDADLQLMKEKGTFFEPNIGLVTQKPGLLTLAVIARHERHACALHQGLGGRLAAHGFNGLGRRTDEREPGLAHRVRKRCVLGQKAVAGMDGLRARRKRGRNDGFTPQV